MTTTANDIHSTIGTSRCGYITVCYHLLVQAFGAPVPPIDEYKSHAEWHVHTPYGIATIYDYWYQPEAAVEQIREWHIGGHNDETAQWIADRLGGRPVERGAEQMIRRRGEWHVDGCELIDHRGDPDLAKASHPTGEYGPYQVHPFLARFPLMTGPEFDALVADIKLNGLCDPIVLSADNKVLIDGRNRYLACLEATADPVFVTLPAATTEQQILDMIVSKNLARRDLSPGQHMALAMEYERFHVAENRDH